MGADAGAAAAGRARVGAARARTGIEGRDVHVPRGHEREGGGQSITGAHVPRTLTRLQPALLAPVCAAGAPSAGGASMRRCALFALALALVATLALPGAASAHPLGNFSINHLSQVRVSSDRVDVLYTLDQAEIPTFQERGLSPAQVLERKRSEVARRLELLVNGRPVVLRVQGVGRISFPPGQGGLRLTREELPLSAAARDPHSVVLRDGTFPDRVGWKAIVAKPGKGTAARHSV